MKDNSGKADSNQKAKEKTKSAVYLEQSIIPIDPTSKLAADLNSKSARPIRFRIFKSPDTKRGFLKWWSARSLGIQTAIISGIFTVLAATVSILPNIIAGGTDLISNQGITAVFEIVTPTIHPNTPIYIKVANGIEVVTPYLDIDLNGIKALKAATLDSSASNSQWSFVPSQVIEFPIDDLKEGRHKIRVGIPGQLLGEEISIHFLSSISSSNILKTDSSQTPANNYP